MPKSVPNRRVPPEDYQSLAEEYVATDVTYEALSQKYGVTRERIRQVIEEVDPEASAKKQFRRAQERADAIWRAVHDGAKSLPQVARWTQIRRETITRTMDAYPELFRGMKGILAKRSPRFRTEKACTKCGEVKPLSEFHRLTGTPDGHGFRCKKCGIATVRKWYENADFDVSVTHKLCPACRKDLPASRFYRARSNKSGLQTYCKPCMELMEEGMSVPEIVEMHGYEYKRTRQDFG